MHSTHTVPSAPVSRSFLQTVGRGVLLFSVVLTAMLFVSWSILLPRFTRFAIGENTLTPGAMAQKEQTLRAELQTMEDERMRLVLPFQDPLYSMLKQQKQALPSAEDIRREMRHAAARAQAAEQVVLQEITLDASQRRVRVTGDVRDADTGSMTVLAAFMGEVERLPFVSALEHPAFSRIDDPVLGIHSPFHFSFLLTPPSQ